MFLKCPCDGAVQTGHRGSQCVGMTSGEGGGETVREGRSPPKVKGVEVTNHRRVGALRVKITRVSNPTPLSSQDVNVKARRNEKIAT